MIIMIYAIGITHYTGKNVERFKINDPLRKTVHEYWMCPNFRFFLPQKKGFHLYSHIYHSNRNGYKIFGNNREQVNGKCIACIGHRIEKAFLCCILIWILMKTTIFCKVKRWPLHLVLIKHAHILSGLIKLLHMKWYLEHQNNQNLWIRSVFKQR